jgi:beta propeller repeat protein
MGHDGDYVVYSDGRSGPGRAAVYVWELRCARELQISSPGVQGLDAFVSDGKAVWVEYPNDGSSATRLRAVVLGYGSAVIDSTRQYDQIAPRFVGDKVVLLTSRLSPERADWGLDLWDIPTDSWTLLSAWLYGAETYDFDGRYVTWAAFPDDSAAWEKDIYVYDVQAAQTRRIVKNPTMQIGTSVDSGRVVWGDQRNGNWDIFTYDLATDVESCLCCDPYDQIAPQISGNLAVWADYRFTQTAKQGGKNDLYLYDLETGVGRRLTTESSWYTPYKIKKGRLAYVRLDLTSPYFPNGYEGYVIDLVRAGVLDQNGHVVAQ